METTLLFVKPDGVQRRLVGRILARLEDRGLQIVGLKMRTIPRELAEEHYKEHEGKGFFDRLIDYVTSGPVVLIAVRGPNAQSVCRKMMGATFCPEAEAGTIRGDFGISKAYNLIHGSDSPEAAQREIGLFFGDGDILEWKFRDRDSLISDED
jgi:nucleoside-diphosphate kinase